MSVLSMTKRISAGDLSVVFVVTPCAIFVTFFGMIGLTFVVANVIKRKRV